MRVNNGKLTYKRTKPNKTDDCGYWLSIVTTVGLIKIHKPECWEWRHSKCRARKIKAYGQMCEWIFNKWVYTSRINKTTSAFSKWLCNQRKAGKIGDTLHVKVDSNTYYLASNKRFKNSRPQRVSTMLRALDRIIADKTKSVISQSVRIQASKDFKEKVGVRLLHIRENKHSKTITPQFAQILNDIKKLLGFGNHTSGKRYKVLGVGINIHHLVKQMLPPPWEWKHMKIEEQMQYLNAIRQRLLENGKHISIIGDTSITDSIDIHKTIVYPKINAGNISDNLTKEEKLIALDEFFIDLNDLKTKYLWGG